MNCPFFEEKNFRYCKAMAKRVLIPSRTEKEEFCCENYASCPYYLEQKTKGKEGACRLARRTGTEESDENKQS
jgi:hypothetical protein